MKPMPARCLSSQRSTSVLGSFSRVTPIARTSEYSLSFQVFALAKFRFELSTITSALRQGPGSPIPDITLWRCRRGPPGC